MNPLNNYRFGSYAILAMGLINLRYQTGNDANLSKSSLLISLGAVALLQHLSQHLKLSCSSELAKCSLSSFSSWQLHMDF